MSAGDLQLRWYSAGRRWLLLAVLVGAGPAAARAQQVLVQANVADDTLKTTFGPNRRWFGHGYVALGLVAGPAESGAGLRYGFASGEARLGGRLKYRLSQTFSLTADVAYAYLRYELAQQAGKQLPNAVLHNREYFGLHQAVGEAALRLNAGRRGNAVGTYLDLVAGGIWAAATRHTTEDVPAPGVHSVETTESGLPYLTRWNGHVGARVGHDRYVLLARYRVSPAFARDYRAWPELPRWVLGVEVGLF